MRPALGLSLRGFNSRRLDYGVPPVALDPHNIRFRTLALFVIAFVCSGCASANIGNMVVRETIKNVKHPVTVAVTTSAEGPAAQWIWSDTIAPEDFRKAIIMSLEKSGLFKAITTDDASDYILNAKLNYVSSHPGFAMHAWVNIAWTLTKRATGDVI